LEPRNTQNDTKESAQVAEAVIHPPGDII